MRPALVLPPVLLVVALAVVSADFGRAATSGTPAAALATPGAAHQLVVNGDPVTSLVPARPDALAIYVVSAKALYRSDSGGDRWERAGPVPPKGKIVVAEDSPLLLLAGDHPNCARGDKEQPLYRSDDGGATWTEVKSVTGVRPLAVWRKAKVAVGASCGGLRLSTDAGLTWRAAPLTPSNYDVTAFAPVAGGDPSTPVGLIAGTSEGGTSRLWAVDLTNAAQLSVGDPIKEFWGAGSLAGRGKLYVLGAADGLWVSIDQGANWKQRRKGLEDVTLSVDPLKQPIPDQELRRGFGIFAIAIDPEEFSRLHIATVNGVYASADAGSSWHRVPGIEGPVTALVVAAKAHRLFAETEAGVLVASPLV